MCFTLYRAGMRKVFGGNPGFTVMCYFHVKQACREYIMKNTKAPNDEKKAIWNTMSADIDYLRAAFTGDDFQTRRAAVLAAHSARTASRFLFFRQLPFWPFLGWLQGTTVARQADRTVSRRSHRRPQL